MSSCTPETLWEIEKRLSQPTFRGVPVGSALAALLHNEIWAGHGDWSFKSAVKNRMRYVYHYLWHLRMRNRKLIEADSCAGRVLLTWFEPHFRCRDLVFPVAKQLGYDRCLLLYALPEMAGLLPPGAKGIEVKETVRYDFMAWRRDYLRFWMALRPVLNELMRQFGLPSGTYHRLADAVLTCTQRIAGYQEYLRRSRVAAVLTEYDRGMEWAALVLSAATLGIPTYTLMHGAPGKNCLGFRPLLADTIFCWGDMFANMFAAAGVDPSRIVVAGCPRLTRDLPITSEEARVKIGLDPDKPAVMLATQNFPWDRRLKLAETFCKAVHGNQTFTSIVRLHPEDKLQGYSDMAARFPLVWFMDNEECSLNTAIAASDIVVVHSSGFGSDALVKRRLTVVLDAIDQPLGHGGVLIEQAGTPRATSAETLLNILRGLLYDAEKSRKHRQLAEHYVEKFCAFFGDESARRIADSVLKKIDVATQ